MSSLIDEIFYLFLKPFYQNRVYGFGRVDVSILLVEHVSKNLTLKDVEYSYTEQKDKSETRVMSRLRRHGSP